MKNTFVLLLGLLAFQAQCQSAKSNQILTDVQILASDSLEGRGTGTAGADKARKYLIRRFEEIGLKPFESGFVQTFNVKEKPAQNLIGYVPGHTDSVIVVTAHYDHLGVKDGKIYYGADDNASGVAGLLAMAQSIREGGAKHTFIFAALDAEEIGLKGAEAFLLSPPVDIRLIKLNINMDMIGHNDTDEIYAVGTYHYPQLIPVLEAVRKNSNITIKFGHDKPKDVQQDWTYSSDHGPFHKRSIPFVYFGVEDHADYHSPTDVFTNINQPFLIESLDTIVLFAKTADAQL